MMRPPGLRGLGGGTLRPNHVHRAHFTTATTCACCSAMVKSRSPWRRSSCLILLADPRRPTSRYGRELVL
jgi:hypothetical protein